MKTWLRSARFGSRGLAAVLGALALLAVPASWAQLGGGSAIPEPDQLARVTATPVEIRARGNTEATFTVQIAKEWHINANPPSPDYMIPTELSLTSMRGIKVGAPRYPAPTKLKVGFEDSELLVYGGQAVFRVPLAASAIAPNGTHRLEGTLRFQACNDQVCLAPATVPIELMVRVVGGSTGIAPDTSAASTRTQAPPATSGSASAPAPSVPATGFATRPPAPGAGRPPALDNPLARAIEGGGWASFLTLFLIGLALNLTPCVYPMLGVTVSIFGARRAAPPLKVLGFAVLYVLGMAVMYSSLGLIAAFTGGLFGGVLQSPIVLVGIGLLLIALSLSMFGLYEFQLPPALLARLGGTGATSAVGTFASGLMVGVFAAPCVGPPIVALLALVGAKGDPWFGFSSFFVLAMGLGAPYLVLGTFSNLIQTLPRSGDWMVWVKKVFGAILFAVGCFYALLAVAPRAAFWVAPIALVVAGIYLGFFEKSAEQRPRFRWFKRAGGAAAAIAGVMLISTAPTEGIAFETLTHEALETTLRSGAPVMLDFTANWCAPCHELERFTFTDRRVREAARRFRAFRVDLTRYDSPEAERWRKQFDITGVPTVVFLTPDGEEVLPARVEGFLPPDPFLERMRHASEAGARAARE